MTKRPQLAPPPPGSDPLIYIEVVLPIGEEQYARSRKMIPFAEWKRARFPDVMAGQKITEALADLGFRD